MSDLDNALESFNAERRHHPLIAALNTARGARYYDLLRQVLADIGPALVADFNRFKADTGKVTLCNLGQLVLRYGLNFKATVEYLEDEHLLSGGMYESLKGRGVKVRDVLDAAREAEAGCAPPQG